MIRNFWKNERPSSTEYETATENSYNLKSETNTEISETKSEQPTETIEDQLKNLELSKIELKSENRKLEYRIKRLQEKLARSTTENGAAEDIRIQMEDELIDCKSRIDQLVAENRQLETEKTKYQAESKEKQAQLEKELSNCKSRIHQLEIDNRLLEMQKKKYQTESQKKQAQLETYQKENNALKKCKLRA